MLKHKDEKYMLAVSDVNNGNESEVLGDKIKYDRAVMYRTVSNDFGPDEPLDYDMLVFFSPQGIDSLLKNFPNFEQGEIAIATFGPSTTQAAKDAGLRVDIEAPSPKFPSMTAAIDSYLAEHNPRIDKMQDQAV